ncbi:DUF397 domain-containing protein [Kitasatospora sp. NPDC056327]|uniref:DUF397 domain-containing protein n=1 Tax=Kitasatospora sp. NPDC056327 TaxID=3345785 RepID=UPI0035DFC43F
MDTQQQAAPGGEGGEDTLEVRTVDGMVELRDTRNDSVVVRTTPRKWAAFVLGVKAGEFDHFVEP